VTAKFKCENEMGDLSSIISCANYITFLGLTIKNDITWDGHIEVTIKKTEYRPPLWSSG
jgi:hypothetical protein